MVQSVKDLEYTLTRIDKETLAKLREMAAKDDRSLPQYLRQLAIKLENQQADAGQNK